MEEETTQKPPVALTVQLFLFMMLVVINFLILPNYLHTYIKDESGLVLGSRNSMIVFGIVDLLASVYAFMSIYRVLQRKPYSIAMLKFTSFYIIFVETHYILEIVKGRHSIAMLIIFGPILIFCVSFCIYLYKSKALKLYIPNQDRKFGWRGWLAVLIIALFIGAVGYSMGKIFTKLYRSRQVAVNMVALQKGEVTDGLIAFAPLKGWKLEPDAGEDFVYSCETDSCMVIAVVTVQENIIYRTDYYRLLSESFRGQLRKTVPMKEVKSMESVINGNKFYLNTYELRRVDTLVPIYWTFSALLDKDSYKVATLSNFETGSFSNSVAMAQEFMERVKFNLKQ